MPKRSKNGGNGPRIDANRRGGPETPPRPGKRGKSTARAIGERPAKPGPHEIASGGLTPMDFTEDLRD